MGLYAHFRAEEYYSEILLGVSNCAVNNLAINNLAFLSCIERDREVRQNVTKMYENVIEFLIFEYNSVNICF